MTRTSVDVSFPFVEITPLAHCTNAFLFLVAIACEVLARRIVHSLSVDRLESVMSTRYRYREEDGDISSPVSA